MKPPIGQSPSPPPGSCSSSLPLARAWVEQIPNLRKLPPPTLSSSPTWHPLLQVEVCGHGTKSQKTFRQSRAPFSHPLPASDGPHRASGPMIVLSYTVHKLVRAVVIHELYILAHSPMRY
uniref:Uncharacterized protein n=1 Tax=Setaria viridis TaxID=4556 RepID=A0A4U6TU52_SETVI|nr:hypothetical protein SEVIR_7G191400v2 [Setaria viridis]